MKTRRKFDIRNIFSRVKLTDSTPVRNVSEAAKF